MTAFMNTVTILGILLTLYYIYRFRQHDKAQMIKETYPEREELAQEAVALGGSWRAMRLSDEIRISSGGVFGLDEYISRQDAKNELKALKALEYEKIKEECRQLRENYDSLYQESAESKEITGELSGIFKAEYDLYKQSNSMMYNTSSNLSGKKSRSKRKAKKK